MNVLRRAHRWWWCRGVQRLARGRPINQGEWLCDLGMPTDRAIRIKTAYDLQNDLAWIARQRSEMEGTES